MKNLPDLISKERLKYLRKTINTISAMSLAFFLFFYQGFSRAAAFYPIDLTTFSLNKFLVEHLPGSYFPSAIIENFSPETTFLIEESNGFSLVDPPKVYFEGDSYLHFNWFINGHRNDSILEGGAPAVLLPLSAAENFYLRGESPLHQDYGLNMTTGKTEKEVFKFSISNVWPNIKGYVPWATTFVNPHATSENRDNRLYSTRRKFVSNTLMDFSWQKPLLASFLTLSLTYFDFERIFNDFNVYNQTYKEQGNIFLAHLGFNTDLKQGSLSADSVINILQRDRDGAELGKLPQETLEKERFSWFSGAHLQTNRSNFRASFLIEKNKLTPVSLNFSKDLKDNDGADLYPFDYWGNYFGLTTRLQIDSRIISSEKLEGKLFFDLKYSSLKGEARSHDFNPIIFSNEPLHVIIWDKNTSFRNTNSQGKLGAILSLSPVPDVKFYSKFLLQYSHLAFAASENNLNFPAGGFDFGLLLFENRKTSLLLACEYMPIEIKQYVNFFLEKNRPGGTIYLWNDFDDDVIYSPGEETDVFGFTGGPFHYTDETLKNPVKKRILINFITPLSRYFQLNIKGIYKEIHHNFRVRHQIEYGFYEKCGEKELYFYHSPFKDFTLSNQDFKENPFYAQFLIHINGKEEEKWFFSFSFMAHIGMGSTAFGNGPSANDIGILDESQANPNSWINSFGRVDGDRAFVGKLYFGFFPVRNLFLAVSLKYRDGNPFAFFDSCSRYDQVVFTYKTIQAEDKRGVKGGPREDYLSDISLKLSYTINVKRSKVKIFLSLFNLMDFGSELSEYVFSGGWRWANEIQIPRSIRAGTEINF